MCSALRNFPPSVHSLTRALNFQMKEKQPAGPPSGKRRELPLAWKRRANLLVQSRGRRDQSDRNQRKRERSLAAQSGRGPIGGGDPAWASPGATALYCLLWATASQPSQPIDQPTHPAWTAPGRGHMILGVDLGAPQGRKPAVNNTGRRAERGVQWRLSKALCCLSAPLSRVRTGWEGRELKFSNKNRRL